MAQLLEHGTWKWPVTAIGIATLALIPLVLLLHAGTAFRHRHGALWRRARYSASGCAGPASNPVWTALSTLAMASRNKDFWLLFATFFICGFTTNGLIGTHMISLCTDNGLLATSATGLMAMMGVFDLVGTTLSGWLTDRYDSRKLLFIYYALRGLSLMYLPYSDFSLYSLTLFAAFYGLDWIATVPPTLAPDAAGVRRCGGADRVRLDRLRASARRGDSGVHGRRHAG